MNKLPLIRDKSGLIQSFTADEQAYIISQLDPFHDDPYRLTGAPSEQNASSVVLTVKKEVVLTAADFGLPTTAGSKWDFHVASLPLTELVSAYPTRMDNPASYIGRTTDTEDSTFFLLPIAASAASTGGKTFSVGATGGAPLKGLASDATRFTPSGGTPTPRTLRVISQAFEVVDESPEIYRQGAVCVYERPTSASLQRSRVTAVPAGDVAVSSSRMEAMLSDGPPNSIQQATILGSSKTWKASEGAYVIGRTCGDNPFKKPGISRTLLSSAN